MAGKMIDKIKAGLSQEESAKKSTLQNLEQKIKRANEVFRDDDIVIAKPKSKIKKDTFTIPEDEYVLIQEMIDRSMKMMKRINKSEVVRLGLISLSKLKDDDLLKLIDRIERLKVGRPKG